MRRTGHKGIELKFYVKYRNKKFDDRPYPYFLLRQDNWDDFDYKTSFWLDYYDKDGGRLELGSVKIMSLRTSEDYDDHGYVKLDEEFEKLEPHFCSLGQELSYYKRAAEKPAIYDHMLVALNDVVKNSGIVEDFEESRVFTRSLIRYSEAELAFRRGARVLAGESPDGTTYKFRFECLIGEAASPHSTEFVFDGESAVPARMMAIIGGNGSGKTQYLSRMALALSGEERFREEEPSDDEGRFGKFSPRRPAFSKIIAVSYSAFDQFERPQRKRTFSYVYCGLKDGNGYLSPKNLERRVATAIEKIVTTGRERVWVKVMENLIDADYLEAITEAIFDRQEFSAFVENKDGRLSSGQSIMMYVVTEMLANIRHDSLVLFDEPEMHLHPTAIVGLIKGLNIILSRFNSYAILATHSPIILQEIPSKFVRVFERIGSTPHVRGLGLESFGENITVITKEVFGAVEAEPLYKKVLRDLAKDRTRDEIEALFDDNLSLNASIYLAGLFDRPEHGAD